MVQTRFSPDYTQAASVSIPLGFESGSYYTRTGGFYKPPRIHHRNGQVLVADRPWIGYNPSIQTNKGTTMKLIQDIISSAVILACMIGPAIIVAHYKGY